MALSATPWAEHCTHIIEFFGTFGLAHNLRHHFLAPRLGVWISHTPGPGEAWFPHHPEIRANDSDLPVTRAPWLAAEWVPTGSTPIALWVTVGLLLGFPGLLLP